MKINVALGISRDWFDYACITATSVLANSSKQDDYCFYILSNGFSDEEKDKFLKLKKLREVDFNFIELEDSYFDGAIHDHLGISASYRLRLQSFCKEDKVIYLDSDVVILQDIAELYKIDISDYYLAAVEDKSSNDMRGRIELIKEGEIFFNSGVQLINLKQFRENNIEEKFMAKLREYSIYTDQDVMNDICYGKILSLPLKYNLVQNTINWDLYTNRKEEYDEAKENPVVLHYWSKPWGVTIRLPQYEEWNKNKDIYDGLK